MAGSRNKNRQHEKDITLCLSDLPDEILIHILSFLPTKSLVATSVLSRRWRYLWTSTRNLELHEYQFNNDHDKFMNFADRALILRAGTSLVSFSLKCRVENDESRINTWITSAIQHNVEKLCLSLRGYKDSFFLPFCIFGCQSLVNLVLDVGSIRIPSVICLPRLKRLSLEGVEFADNESAEKLLSHPMLEQLSLFNCTWYNVTTVNVNSPKLQRLTIEEEEEAEDDWSQERQVCFFCDNLTFFRYDCFLPPTQYCICGSTMQLRKAVILVEYHDHEVQNMDGPSNRYCKLLNSLSGVQNLTLSEETAQSLHLLSQCPLLQTTLPVFYRLTRLNLKSSCDSKAISLNSNSLTMVYKRCPHLEHLNFMGMIELDFPAPVLRPMSSCFRTHLKKVTLLIFEPESGESGESDYHLTNISHYKDAFNLLFNSAPVLEEVVIYWDDCISGHISTVEELECELNASPKVSENCRVSIVLVDICTFENCRFGNSTYYIYWRLKYFRYLKKFDL